MQTARPHNTSTFIQSRQQILHKFICVNGIVVTRPSFELNPGDIISISPQAWIASCLPTVLSSRPLKAPLYEVKGLLWPPKGLLSHRLAPTGAARKPLSEATLSRPKSPFNRIGISLGISRLNPKPLHLEINYNHFIAVFLYTPQQLFYPAQFDLNLLNK